MNSIMEDTMLQCTTTLKDLNVNQILRCSDVSDPQSCKPGLFLMSSGYSITVCPLGSDQWLPLLYLSILLTVLQVLSIFSVIIMNYLSEQMNKFKVSIFLNRCSSDFPLLWKEKDKDWQEDAMSFLEVMGDVIHLVTVQNTAVTH